MKTESCYQKRIREELQKQHRNGVDPRHIEAYLRLQYGTLDSLTRDEFSWETAIALACIDAVGVKSAEDLALSYGL